MTRFIALFLVTLCAASPALACKMTQQEKENLFVNFDRNRDQKVDLFEYMFGETNRFGQNNVDTAALRQRFMGMDTLQRGWVTPDSFYPINTQKCLPLTQQSY